MTVVVRTITAISSTVGSGATVSTYSQRVTTPWRSLVKMTRRTVRERVRLEEIFTNKNDLLKRPAYKVACVPWRPRGLGAPNKANSRTGNCSCGTCSTWCIAQSALEMTLNDIALKETVSDFGGSKTHNCGSEPQGMDLFDEARL